MNPIDLGPWTVGPGEPLTFFSGPCVIEGRDKCLAIAEALAELARDLDLRLVFKASYDKANRTSVDSYRGPGIEEGLKILAEVKEQFGFQILTDVHAPEQVAPVAEVADVLQLPAFLCRQTDLVLALGESGKVVKIKKGQFLSPGDVGHVVRKIESTGNRRILITERGTSFGYGHLVADMRSLVWLREHGYPIVFDATHSVQRPGSPGSSGFTGGDGALAPVLARAAVAVGVNAVFMETHLNPSEALSDKQNAVPFGDLRGVMETLLDIHAVLNPATA